ncbi:hypothetical protein KCU66_g76, partial [Aureobasidium melanogenum]
LVKRAKPMRSLTSGAGHRTIDFSLPISSASSCGMRSQTLSAFTPIGTGTGHKPCTIEWMIRDLIRKVACKAESAHSINKLTSHIKIVSKGREKTV